MDVPIRNIKSETGALNFGGTVRLKVKTRPFSADFSEVRGDVQSSTGPSKIFLFKFIEDRLKPLSPQRRFKCSICRESYDKKLMLLRHLSTHERIAPLSCRICGKNFEEVLELRDHAKTHVQEKPFKCQHCSYEVNDLSLLKLHRGLHKEKPVFKCCQCTFSTQAKKVLDKHALKHIVNNGKPPKKCSSCDESFLTFSRLRKHQILHSKDNIRKYLESFTDEAGSLPLEVKAEIAKGLSQKDWNEKSLSEKDLTTESKGLKEQRDGFSCKKCRVPCASEKHLCLHYDACHRLPVLRLKHLIFRSA